VNYITYININITEAGKGEIPLLTRLFLDNLKYMIMKKMIFLLVAISLVANIISAQKNSTDLRDKVQFGLKAGANYSNVYDTKDQEFTADYKFGFAGGAFLAIPAGKFLGIQPEILFSQKGYKASGTFLTIPYEYTHTTSYIDIPLLVSLKPSPFLTLLAGPQYSLLITEKNEFTSGSFTETQQREFENNKSVFCFLGGIDFNVDMMVLGLRAGWDLQNNNGDGTTTNPRYRNMWYQGTLGIRF
jgi:hypothetical protein